jgi:hypothetical protein
MSSGTTGEGTWTKVGVVATVVGGLVAIIGLAIQSQPPPHGPVSSSAASPGPSSPGSSVPSLPAGREPSPPSEGLPDEPARNASVYHEGILTIRKGGWINYDAEPDDLSWRGDTSFYNLGYQTGRRLRASLVSGLPVGRNEPTYEDCVARTAEYRPQDEFDGTAVTAGSHYCLRGAGMYGRMRVVAAEAESMRIEIVVWQDP